MAADDTIITEGWLEMKSKHIKSWRKRWIVITNDRRLLSYKTQQKSKAPTEEIQLSPTTIIKSINVALQTTFSISNEKQFKFRARSLSDKLKWMEHITTLSQERGIRF